MKTKADKQTSLRLTPEAKRLLQELATKLGVTQAAIIEIAIRRLAELEGIPYGARLGGDE